MDELRRAHFAAADGLVARFGGRVVKTIGDSVMAAFHAATDALDFALAVTAAPGDARIQLRAGLHVGLVTVEDADLHGSAVSYAARVVAAAKGPEIWLSSEARSHVDQQRDPQHAQLAWAEHAGIEMKGFVGKHILWSVAGR
jgi:class 3 adenylate cyclase